MVRSSKILAKRPQPPPSAYTLWFAENRSALQEFYPAASDAHIARFGESVWRRASCAARAPWFRLADSMQADYYNEMDKFVKELWEDQSMASESGSNALPNEQQYGDDFKAPTASDIPQRKQLTCHKLKKLKSGQSQERKLWVVKALKSYNHQKRNGKECKPKILKNCKSPEHKRTTLKSRKRPERKRKTLKSRKRPERKRKTLKSRKRPERKRKTLKSRKRPERKRKTLKSRKRPERKRKTLKSRKRPERKRKTLKSRKRPERKRKTLKSRKPLAYMCRKHQGPKRKEL